MWTQFKHYNSSFVVEKSWQPKSRTRSVWKFSVTNPSIDIQARRPREKLRAFFDNQLSPVAKEPSLSLSCFPDDFTFVLFFFFSLSSFHPSFTGSLEGTSSFTSSVFDGSLFASNIIVWINCEAKKLYIRELSRSRVLFVRKILFVGTKFLFKLLRFSFFKLTIW